MKVFRSGGTRLAIALVRAAALLIPESGRRRFVQEWRAELIHESTLPDGLSPLAVSAGVLRDALQLRKLKLAGKRHHRRLMIMVRFHAWGRDIRIAARGLLRSPLYAIVAILTLGVGLGGTSAALALLDRVVLDPLPYPNADRLVRLSNRVPGVEPDAEWHMSSAQFFYLTDHSTSFEGIGAYRLDAANIGTPSGPQRALFARISASLFPMIGARALLGRLIDAADDQPGQPMVAVLSDGFWRRQMGADPNVLGRVLTVNEVPVEVVGVLEPGLALPRPGATVTEGPDFWLPMQLNSKGPFANNHVIPMIAMLRDDVDPAFAETEIAQLTTRLPEAFPDAYPEEFLRRYGFRTAVTPLKEYVISDVASALWILTGALGLVLIVAYANVTNLFLARMEERKQELTVRSALGAGSVAIARLILAESFTLAFAGGALGLLVGFWGVPAMVALAPTTLPRMRDIGFDASGVLITSVLVVVVGFALAVFPMLSHLQAHAKLTLASVRSTTAGRERQRVRSGMVVGQVALALMLVVSAGLLMASHRRLQQVNPGVDAEGVVSVQLHLAGPRYQTWAAFWGFYSEVLDGVRALPGVVAAGMTSDLPFSDGFGCTVQGFEDRAVYDRLNDDGMTTCAGQSQATPGYFESMGVPILRGRALVQADNDQPGRGAVVVSQAYADRFWPGEDPMGQGVAPSGRRDGPFYHVVGVAGDVYASSLNEEPALAVYYPVVAIPGSGGLWPAVMNLVVKTDLSQPSSILPSVRQRVLSVDPSIPIANPQDMEVAIEQSMSGLTFMSVLLQIAAGTALLLASVGLYGVISYLVARRTKEIGMRIAMGARPFQVERLVVGKSVGLLLLGLGFGVVFALAGTRVLQRFLYGVEPTNPGAYAVAIVILSTVTLIASWIPARRAARIDPSDALRSE